MSKAVALLAGTDPAANTEITYTFPGTSIDVYEVLSFSVVLVTSGVANRRVEFTIDDGTTVYFRSSSATNQTDAQTVRYTMFAGDNSGTIVNSASAMLAGPRPFFVKGGYRIKTVTASIAAGDNYGAPAVLVSVQ